MGSTFHQLYSLQDTVGLQPPLPLRLLGYGKPFLYLLLEPTILKASCYTLAGGKGTESIVQCLSVCHPNEELLSLN